MRKQILISIQDLRYATMHCRRCRTSVTVDLEVEFEAPRSAFRAPRECPRCSESYDSAVPPAIEALQRSYRALAPLKDSVSFALNRDDPAETPDR